MHNLEYAYNFWSVNEIFVWRRWLVVKVFPNLSSPCALALTCEKLLVCLYKQPNATTNKRRNNLVFWVSISLVFFLCFGNLWSYETMCRSYSKQEICMSGINNDDVHKSVDPSIIQCVVWRSKMFRWEKHIVALRPCGNYFLLLWLHTSQTIPCIFVHSLPWAQCSRWIPNGSIDWIHK